MKAQLRSMLTAALAVATFGAGVQGAPPKPLLFGTTGRCNNVVPGGPCTQTSTLVQLDPETGTLIRAIGPVGYTVNGLAWDTKTEKMYASTAIGDVNFHGLITIDLTTGAGTPVNPNAPNFGLAGAPSPIHSNSVNTAGRMVGWYDEFPEGLVTDTFVTIDKSTGIATEFPNTGIDTSQNGLSFDRDNLLWNIDKPRQISPSTPPTQKAYLLDPRTGKPLGFILLSPPTMAALGDFNPVNNLYYGLQFTPFQPAGTTFMVVVDVSTGLVTRLGPTVDNLHTLAFIRKLK